MKTLAALGLLLFSGVLVVSGAMMGSVTAQQDADDPVAPRALGPVEVRVFLEGPDGRAWPRGRVDDPAVLVEARAEPRAVEPGPGRRPDPLVPETPSRRLDLDWVEPRPDGARDGDGRSPGGRPGRARRNEAGDGARVVFVERPGHEEPAGPGGYWRAVYTPPADRRVVSLGATVIFTHDGTTRTIAGFAHPHPGDGQETGAPERSVK